MQIARSSRMAAPRSILWADGLDILSIQPEALQSGLEVCQQVAEPACQRPGAGDQYIVGGRLRVAGQDRRSGGAQTSAGAVAGHGVADLGARGEADPGRRG